MIFAVRNFLPVVFLSISLFNFLLSQSTSDDTLKVKPIEGYSEPVEIDTTNGITLGEVFLGASAVVGIPIAFGLTLLSFLPPSYVGIIQDGKISHGFGFEFALGKGAGERFRFSSERFLIQLSNTSRFKWRVSFGYERDITLKRFGRGKIFGYGLSAGVFASTNFGKTNSVGIGFSIWLGNAMNIPYLFLFPQHHVFIRLRNGILNKRNFTEVNIGVSSSITFKR